MGRCKKQLLDRGKNRRVETRVVTDQFCRRLGRGKEGTVWHVSHQQHRICDLSELFKAILPRNRLAEKGEEEAGCRRGGHGPVESEAAGQEVR
jgi:hypothetical protein